MNYKESTWINQSLYSYKDKSFNSKASIEIGMSMNTNDNISFNAPRLSIRIKSDIGKDLYNLSLSYSNIFDFLTTLEEPISNPDLSFEQNIDVNKRYNNGKNLICSFRTSQSGSHVIIISIAFSDTDSMFTIIPFEEFLCLMEVLKAFKDSYINISLDLPKRLPNQEFMNKLSSIEQSIKLIPSLIQIPEMPKLNDIIPQFSNSKSHNETVHQSENTLDLDPKLESDEEKSSEDELPWEGEDVINHSSDFLEFAEKNEDSIEIPTMDVVNEDVSEKDQEIQSDFITKVLKNDINTFASMMTTISHNSNSFILEFIDRVSSILNITKEDLLPGLSDIDLKSLSYLSKYTFKMTYQEYIDDNIPIPISGFGLYKYEPKNISNKNIELAYDLLLLMCYIKLVRQKLEAKEDDSNSNQAVLHLSSRLITDVFAFSFIQKFDENVIKNCILTRYRQYSKNGFFDKFEEKLSTYNCTPTNEIELIDLINELKSPIDLKMPINKFHNHNFETKVVMVGPENDFDLEQISDKVPSAELRHKLGKDILETTQDEEIINFFKLGKVVKPKTTNKSKTNSILHKFVIRQDSQEMIPERFRDVFTNAIAQIKDEDFDLSTSEFPLSEFGDDIIKAIYLWNQSDKNLRWTTFITGIIDDEQKLKKDIILETANGISNLEDTTETDGADFMELI